MLFDMKNSKSKTKTSHRKVWILIIVYMIF